jgi:hypothetical protein
MNNICIHSLALFAGALGCAALAHGASDLPSRELLNSYSYQPLPAITLPDGPNPAVFAPTVAPDFEVTKAANYDWRDLEEAMARNKAEAHVLFTWDWRRNATWQILSRPNVEEINIPWSPMTTPNDSTIPSASVGNATAKLQARFPLVSLVW